MADGNEKHAVWTEDGESFKTGSSATRDRQDLYIEWLLTPAKERSPKTKGEFADTLGVSTSTLRNYAKDPRVQSELVKRGRAINRVERASDVLDALYRKATSVGDRQAVSAAKVWLDWTDKQVNEGDGDLEDLTDQELMDKLAEMYEVVEKRGKG